MRRPHEAEFHSKVMNACVHAYLYVNNYISIYCILINKSVRVLPRSKGQYPKVLSLSILHSGKVRLDCVFFPS